MPLRALTITKKTPFRGKDTTFSNTYFYYNEVAGTNYEGMVDDVVAKEKKLHSASVTYLTARLWSAGGSPQENETLLIKDLSGTGTGPSDGTMDRERAILVSWDCGRNILGRKVYLRKWFHSCGVPEGASVFSASIHAQTAQIPQATRDTIASLAAALETVGFSTDIGWVLCSPKGVTHKTSAVAYPWLEHHQLGESWRN